MLEKYSILIPWSSEIFHFQYFINTWGSKNGCAREIFYENTKKQLKIDTVKSLYT